MFWLHGYLWIYEPKGRVGDVDVDDAETKLTVMGCDTPPPPSDHGSYQNRRERRKRKKQTERISTGNNNNFQGGNNSDVISRVNSLASLDRYLTDTLTESWHDRESTFQPTKLPTYEEAGALVTLTVNRQESTAKDTHPWSY